MSNTNLTVEDKVKQKAKELVEKFWHEISGVPPRCGVDVHSEDSYVKIAKQCALISLDREIEVIHRLLATGLNNDFDLLRERGELFELRTAIENL